MIFFLIRFERIYEWILSVSCYIIIWQCAKIFGWFYIIEIDKKFQKEDLKNWIVVLKSIEVVLNICNKIRDIAINSQRFVYNTRRILII